MMETKTHYLRDVNDCLRKLQNMVGFPEREFASFVNLSRGDLKGLSILLDEIITRWGWKK